MHCQAAKGIWCCSRYLTQIPKFRPRCAGVFCSEKSPIVSQLFCSVTLIVKQSGFPRTTTSTRRSGQFRSLGLTQYSMRRDPPLNPKLRIPPGRRRTFHRNLDQRYDQGCNSEQLHYLVLFEIDKTYSRVKKEIYLCRKLGVVITQRPDIAVERF